MSKRIIKPNPISWEERWRLEREHACLETAKFLDGWGWTQVFHCWQERISDFAVRIESLFTDIHVHDPHNPTGRESQISWWPTRQVRRMQRDLQRHFFRYPGTMGRIHRLTDYSLNCELNTLEFLWHARNEPEKIAAILIAASLFTRIRGRRSKYSREFWPREHCARGLESLALTRWHGEDAPWEAWAHHCGRIMPLRNDDDDYIIESLPALVRYLAEEHSAILCSYSLVNVHFSATCDALLELEIRNEKIAEEKAHQERLKSHELLEAERLEQNRRLEVNKRELDEQKRERHPRWGEWNDLADSELKRLVWSMPTTKIAAEFGVSDSAIAKRCKTVGISKPPAGFWAKVASKAIPHPNGEEPPKLRR